MLWLPSDSSSCLTYDEPPFAISEKLTKRGVDRASSFATNHYQKQLFWQTAEIYTARSHTFSMSYGFYLIALLLLVFTAACIGSPVTKNNGLVLDLQADPSTVFENSDVMVHVDLDNTDSRRLYNVKAEIFDSGALSSEGACEREYGILLPEQFETFTCNFKTPSINQQRFSTEIGAKAVFDVPFAFTQTIEAITEQEFRNRQATNSLQTKPSVYRHRDRNIAVDVEFSEPLPMVVKDGKEIFVKFTIRNIGNGFVDSLESGDITITQKIEQGETVLDTGCIPGELLPLGKEFPTFTCKINPFYTYLPDTDLGKGPRPIQSYDITMNIDYNYEIRDSLKIDVIR